MLAIFAIVAAAIGCFTGYQIGWLDGFRRGVAVRPTPEAKET
jgi:hypothetical protein